MRTSDPLAMLVSATFIVLAFSVVALWFGGRDDSLPLRRHLWLHGLAMSLVLGTFAGLVSPAGLVAGAAFIGVAHLYYRGSFGRVARGLLGTALLGFAALLMLHQVPGFVNPRVISGMRFTPDAVPFSLYLNLDKTLVGVCLIGWGLRRARTRLEWREVLRRMAPIALGTIGAVLLGSLAAGYVRFAPKLPAETWLWAAVNLLFVCTAEEALFRGFIQTELAKAWAAFRFGASAAIAIAAVLFGIAHAAGGPVYVTLATVAGLGYGLAYQRTGRIEGSILTHFGLNTLHFLLFTYPALAK